MAISSAELLCTDILAHNGLYHSRSGKKHLACLLNHENIIAKGWTITRNGTKIECDLTEDTFITIPLENGTNVIEMNYSIPNFTPGIIATLAGVVLLLGVVIFEQKKKA